ncbi:MAG: T9SS type A sorting domain-containing protein [candidate division Zixibacteria bacterium]|nr:T9SS type A sorting domain-containing protein [candidate division Zixibacteria bacterium]
MIKLLKISILLLVFTGILLAQPVLEVSPAPLKFGYISIGGGSQQRDLTLSNTGNQSLFIYSCSFESPFYISIPESLVIAPSDSVIVACTFTPSSEIPYNDDIIFYNNGANPEYNLDISANGTRAFQPGEKIWSFQHIENVECVEAVDDYNGDGIPDVIAEGFDAGAVGDPLVCLSGSGNDYTEIIWSVQPQGGPSNSGGWGDKCVAYTDDLNGDGYKDILRGGAWGSRTIFAIDGLTGAAIWSYDTYTYPPSGWIYSVAKINDLNGDGISDVLASAGSDADKAYCLNGATGELIWQYTADDAVSQIAPLADINDDGLDEAVFASMDYGEFVYCISGASHGSGIPLWMFNTNANTFSVCTIKDIDDDEYDDVIVGTWSNRGIMAFSGHRFGQGMILWETPLNTYIMKVVSCPDLDGDDYEDVLVASWSNYAYAYSGVDGSEIWRCGCWDDVWAIDYVDDINGDGIPEVIAGSFAHEVFLIDGARGIHLWQCNVGAKPFSVRNIGDVNGDGFEDIIAGTQMLGDEGGKVFVISGGEPQSSMDENPAVVPKDYLALSNYPNPFNSSTIIQFNLEQAVNYKLTIYNINGRFVDQLSGNGQTGVNTVKWDLSDRENIVSGVYFYQIEAGDKTGHSKMLFLK